MAEQNDTLDGLSAQRFIARRLRDRKLHDSVVDIVDGVQRHQEEVDQLISRLAQNWSLERMAAIDRNILRLGAYEMLHCPQVPPKVAINEAVEMAKRYSTAQSSRFVNGILNQIFQHHLPGSAPDPGAAEGESGAVAPDPEPPGDAEAPAAGPLAEAGEIADAPEATSAASEAEANEAEAGLRFGERVPGPAEPEPKPKPKPEELPAARPAAEESEAP